VPSLRRIKDQKLAIIRRHAHSADARGMLQSLATLVPIVAIWTFVIYAAPSPLWISVVAMLLFSLFSLRVFALMHECGHGSLFRSAWLNRSFGFLFGVLSGMPQYVWSRHHSFHHANNGNWEKYRGPLSTASIDEYEAMSATEQRRYRNLRNILLAPVGGFIYLIFNPRFTWIKGSLQYAGHVLGRKIAQPGVSLKEHGASFKTCYWNSRTEYWHMFWNNVALLGAWFLMCQALGAVLFFSVYLVGLSLAGAAGLILFTVQHNFEHSYASDTAHWDDVAGAIRGTTYLVLPGWLNWFTADIGYHHIHHLSSRIPNYRLAICHEENKDLFTEVVRLRLSEIPGALKCILWDRSAQRIISVAEYRRHLAQDQATRAASPAAP
jgi:acyl-lipid omega-6 desaturase (Delta-12 desaturase)